MKKIVTLVLLALVLGLGGIAIWVYHSLRASVHHDKSGQYIDISRGSSPTAIIRKLAAAGVIRNEWPLILYVRLTGEGSRFKAGEYRFPSPISPLAVFDKLKDGEERVIRLTIIEGWSRWDIARAMVQIPELQLDDIDKALELMNDVSLIKDIDPAAENLEGYLYPDTYELPEDVEPSAVIATMVKRFRTAWKPEWSAKAESLKMSPRDTVTIASLIETEAKLSSERPLISSVIYNRLVKDMPLAIDSTVIYAAKLEGKWRNDRKVYKSDIERRSPYNTRLKVGLPPGPVASPGASSLVAALNPAATDYLFYVREPSRNDGAHNFYNNEKDFYVGVQALRNWEHQRDLENAKRKAQESNGSR
ncbi:MAG TPA: endolytic transglycosylase MltG [Pyrinomonadaceae bacterium]|nr:endolytic transglycosylase MltG [Pyrinomonadaceae bacterium]